MPEKMLMRRQAASGWLSDRVAGVILAGGKNSRMGGRDKAFLTVAGRTIFERALAVMHGSFPQVVVVTNRPQRYTGFDVQVTSDEFPGGGPLAGIHAALGVVDRPYVFVVACDMPFLRLEPIEFLVRRIAAQDAIIPCWEGDIEPLHAVYATALRSRMAAVLQSGARAIRDFLPSIGVEYVPETVLRTVPGVEETFCNVNTPEDAARVAVQLPPTSSVLAAVDAGKPSQ